MDTSKVNSERVIVSPPNDGGVVLQQHMPALQHNAGPDRQKNYPKMKVIPIKIFSATCIILGITLIGIQVIRC